MKNRFALPGSLCLILLLFVTSATAKDKIKFGKISDYEKAVGPPVDYPEANSLILFDRANATISNDNIEFKYHVRMKVLTVAGVDEIGEHSVTYYKKYDKLKRFKAHTITPDGKKHKIEKNAIFEKTSGNVKRKTFAFPALEPGAIIEYQYSIISKRYQYLKPWYFQNNIYTLKSEFSATVGSGFTYNVLYQNVPPEFREAKMKEVVDINQASTFATLKTYTWTRENLPPITDEPYMSDENDYRSSLRFQLVTYEDAYNYIKFLKTWPELGEIKQKDFDDYCNKDKEIKKLAEEVTQGLNTDIEKSRAIYEFVTNEYKTSEDYVYRYFVNEKLSDMLREKRGSGEEKNILLARMHAAAGIPSWPVLISLRTNSRFNPDFPYLPQFNYIIAFVQFEKSYEFLDTSNKLSPYGILPPQCLADGGLLVDGKNSELVRIPIRPIESIRTDRTRVYVSADGQVACSTQSRFTGYYASRMAKLLEKKDTEEFVKDYFVEDLNVTYSLGDYECALDSAGEFVMTANFTADELVTTLDNNLLIQTPRYYFQSNPFKSEKRFFPVDFTYPFTYRNIVDIFLEDTAVENILPESFFKVIDGAQIRRNASVNDSCITVDFTLIVEEPLFRPAKYPELRELFDMVARTDEDKVTVVLAGEE